MSVSLALRFESVCHLAKPDPPDVLWLAASREERGEGAMKIHRQARWRQIASVFLAACTVLVCVVTMSQDQSVAATFNTTQTGDATPPSTPTGLTVSGKTQTSLTLKWTASTANVGVTGYSTFQNGVTSGNVTTLSKTYSSGMTCGTTYTLGVAAFDAAGNESPTATVQGTTSACTVNGAKYSHIVWVVMENHSYAQIHGSTSAPYINSLMNTYGSATNMHATSHPSAANYVDMTSGGNGNCCTDDGYHQLNVASIFSQLGTGARSLMQSMPSPCDTGNRSNYAIRHNPEPYYVPKIGQSLCNSQDVPLGSTPDLSAKFTFIAPDVCHDMHSNSCSGSSDVIKQGDTYLSQLVPQLLASPQYQAGATAIFITWDEDNTSNLNPNQIPTVIIDRNGAHTTGTCAGVSYSHYSMLQYVEDTFGLSRLGSASSATSMKGCFGL